MKKKIGPLEAWQWAVLAGGAGLVYYLYKKKSEATTGVTPEEEEKLLAGLEKASAAGGGGSGGETAVHAPAGEFGPAGAPGATGPAGAEGASPNLAPIETKLSALEADVAKNQPPTGAHTTAAQALPKGESRNAQGEVFRVVVKGNNIFHEYLHRTGPTKVLKVGEVHHQAKKPMTKSKKKAPIHKRVTAHKG
jgi:hypothetical protein